MYKEIQELKVNEYMIQALYKAISDCRAKEYEYASNEVKVDIALSMNELLYLYECVGGCLV